MAKVHADTHGRAAAHAQHNGLKRWPLRTQNNTIRTNTASRALLGKYWPLQLIRET